MTQTKTLATQLEIITDSTLYVTTSRSIYVNTIVSDKRLLIERIKGIEQTQTIHGLKHSIGHGKALRISKSRHRPSRLLYVSVLFVEFVAFMSSIAGVILLVVLTAALNRPSEGQIFSVLFMLCASVILGAGAIVVRNIIGEVVDLSLSVGSRALNLLRACFVRIWSAARSHTFYVSRPARS